MASSEQQTQEQSQQQQTPLSAGNDGGSGGKGESASATTGFPGLGQVRCYWTIMDAMMNFRYLDPVLQCHMHEQAPLMLGKNLVDFIHPEEKEAAKNDFAQFRSSTTIFGSVTRCRYARPVHCRRILGAADPESDGDGAGKYLDENWLACRVTASVVAENTVLTFFHGLQDVDPAVDNDEAHINDWTNWCGPRVAQPADEYLSASTCELLSAAFQLCQDESEEMEAKIARIESNGELPGTPSYVFQILDSRSTQILFTWPPSKPTGKGYDTLLYGGEPGSDDKRYSPEEYAALAKSVISKPRANVPAETNCTKRFQSTHPIVTSFDVNKMYSIESVVITYQALTFVCFQTGGILLNGNNVSTVSSMPLTQQQINEAAESQANKRLRDVENGGNGLLGAYAQQGTGENGYGNSHSQFAQWQQPDLDDGSLQSPYYQGSSYPSVYSSMFNSGGGDGGFMAGSTSIPPMPNAVDTAAANASGSNGLQNLALASSSSYYTDYSPNGQYPGTGDGTPTSATFAHSVNRLPDGSQRPAPVLHRVRKNDRNRICTSCGTTNSPEWRKGPSGIKTLCNACGLRYSRAQSRKAKKAQKEAQQAAAAAAGAAGSSSHASGSGAVHYQMPAQMHVNTSVNAPSHDNEEPESPYLNLDYAGQAQQRDPGLPPLPHEGGSNAPGAEDGSANADAAGLGQHPGSTAPNYGGYGSFHGFTPYGEWSPAGDSQYTQQQQTQDTQASAQQ